MAVTALGSLKETLLSWAWPPAVNLARRAVLSIFSNVETGSLLIKDEASGTKHFFGQSFLCEDGSGAEVKSAYAVPSVEILIKRETFWLRLFLFADIGFAESYMLGDFECNDLTSFFRVCTCPTKTIHTG